jgi:hypothetical protein
MSKPSDADRKVFTDLYAYFTKYHDKQFDKQPFIRAADDMALHVNQNQSTLLAQIMFLSAYEYFSKRYLQERVEQDALEQDQSVLPVSGAV